MSEEPGPYDMRQEDIIAGSGSSLPIRWRLRWIAASAVHNRTGEGADVVVLGQ
jgi:hypothetical protein